MALEKLKSLAQKLNIGEMQKWIKKPWEITGPCANKEEYVDALPKALEYRRFAPATPPVLPRIPNSEPDRVFDIVYYPRDTRRNFRHRKVYVQSKQELEAENNDKQLDMTKFVGSGSYPLWNKVVDPNHEPGNGYQK